MSDVQATFLATMVDEWARGGVTDAVVCPGNRSTLLAALLEAEERIRVHVMVDERSASFFALGLGLATGRPAVFWCTSGTATSEVHAAVIEAHQAKVPLLVATADRPPELQHARDWQSIDQSRLFEGATRWRYDPGVADEAMASSWRSIAARSVLETMHHPTGAGPVHLNISIREPWTLAAGTMPEGRPSGQPWHAIDIGPSAPPASVKQALVAGAGKPGVIVVGQTDAKPSAIHSCAAALGWPVIAEARSGARIPEVTTVAAADAMLRSPAFRNAHKPEMVLRIGTPVISKAVASWLRDAHAEEWLVDTTDTWAGPVTDATRIVRADPTFLCLAIASACTPHLESRWLQKWQGAEARAQGAIDDALSTVAMSEAGVARALMAELPTDSNLFAATSMPVRDVEWYSAPQDRVTVFANRGASGMDGIVSSAAGVAVASGRPTVLFTGDLTFLYDLNALWVSRGSAVTVDLTIVVIDNNGGGIFSTLPQVRELDPAVFERVVATPTSVDIPAAVRGLGLPCETVDTVKDVVSAVRWSFDRGGVRVIHVRTDRATTAAQAKAIHAAVAAAI